MSTDDMVKSQTGTGVDAFTAVSSNVSFPKIEENILLFWRKQDIFLKTVESREGGPRFTVFEGPPTANGSPGIHHVLSRVFKDIFPRYKSMLGYYAPRKGGWDTHGLPVELEIEKQLGIHTKAEIEEYGVESFNQLCRESVFRYVKDWEAMTERVGFWVDLDNAYVTYRNDYIETSWWIIKTLWDSGLVYQGRRVAPHCPRCGTTLSSHEVALGYKDNTPDPSIYVKFEAVVDGLHPSLAAVLSPDGTTTTTYLLAWTTTPWTLPGNSGLSVSADDVYVVVEMASGERFILAEALLRAVLQDDYVVRGRCTGGDLAGLRYKPLYNPWEFGIEVHEFSDRGSNVLNPAQPPPGTLTYPVVGAHFVSMDDGTGIVHTAPPFGEDDYVVGSANGLYFIQPVNLSGVFEGTYVFAGKFVKNADAAVIEDLKARGLLYRRETVKHTYPFCWRCDTPLLYYAKSSWYLRTSSVKDRMVAANEEINWTPEHIKNGRFGDWLRGNVDWAVSRERYWGTPWPVWRCESCGEDRVIGGRSDLANAPNVRGYTDDLDLHRPRVDQVTFDCLACGGNSRRVPEVMDAWFDSGAMPFAQWHYPFDNEELIDSGSWYPADFICEAVDQTRGWFYSLHAIACLLESAIPERISAPSYRNVISLGLILDGKGEKMSKSRGNVVAPNEVIETHGADALRWYLYSAAPAGNNRRFSPELVAEGVRKFLLTLWNTYSFFVTYATLDKFVPSSVKEGKPVAELDRWALSRLNMLVGEVRERLDAFDATGAARRIQNFVDDLSNWYVRRSRRRFWKSSTDADKEWAYSTLYTCLVTLTKLLAPFTPFVAEEMYRNLVCSFDSAAAESVHLTEYPSVDASLIDMDVADATNLVIKTVSLGRAARSKSKIRVRQPLQRFVIVTSDLGEKDALSRLASHIHDELNVKEVDFADDDSSLVEFQVKPKLQVLGPKYGQDLKKVVEALEAADHRSVARTVRAGSSVNVEGFTIDPEGLEVVTVDKKSYATAVDGALTVAITTDITADLAMEGRAREIVHRIQNMRKAAGFDIADRITVYYSGDEGIGAVFKMYAAYIQQETLAEELLDSATAEKTYKQTQEFDGGSIELAVEKVQ